MGEVVQNRDYRFDVQLAEGLAVEGWFYELTRGGDRFEVKHDREAIRTGNVYVEYENDPGARDQWKPSGIATSEADCWIFVLGDPAPVAFVGVERSRLLELARSAVRRGRSGHQRAGSCPTRGALVRLSDLLGVAT